MRGQAFEVFRLLIAAVVAGAILMVLLGMLQNLITPTTDPQTAAAQLVKKFATYGGYGSTDYIQFRKGMAIDAEAIAREAYLGKGCVDIDSSDVSNLFKTCEDRDTKTCVVYDYPVGSRVRIIVNCEQQTGGECNIKCTLKLVK